MNDNKAFLFDEVYYQKYTKHNTRSLIKNDIFKRYISFNDLITHIDKDIINTENLDAIVYDAYKNYNINKSRIVSDSIYGSISFSNEIWENIIDTIPFQRMRSLKQLQACYFVYPSATHTRFEHSIGVGYLAQELFDNIIKGSIKNNFVNQHKLDNLRTALAIAGLCHDIGHGPFSHMYEQFLARKNIKFRHEQASIEIFSLLVDEKNFMIEDYYKEFIKNSITGTYKVPNALQTFNQNIDISINDTFKQLQRDNFVINDCVNDDWLNAMKCIISNNISGIDIDRLDYINRDGSICHPSLAMVNYNRIIRGTKIINNILAYDKKILPDIFEFFTKRFEMYYKVYMHKAVGASSNMILDIYELLDSTYKLSEAYLDLKYYLTLNDSIVSSIPSLHNIYKSLYCYNSDVVLSDQLKNISQANKIYQDLQKRNLYIFIGEFFIDSQQSNRQINAEDLLNSCSIPSNIIISPEDIIIQAKNLSYGNVSNMWNNIYFYSSTQLNADENNVDLFQLNEAAKKIYPNEFEQRSFEVYSKKTDVTVIKLLRLGFLTMISKYNLYETTNSFGLNAKCITPRTRKNFNIIDTNTFNNTFVN